MAAPAVFHASSYTHACSSKDGAHTQCQMKIGDFTESFCSQHSSVSDLKAIVKEKILLEESFELCSEEDATIVDDDDYLKSLPEDTTLIVFSDEMTVQDMDVDREPYDAAVEKLKGNLGSVFVLSQDELLALHEADEERLKSLLSMTPKAADDFRWLCFDIASRRDEEKDKLDYLELCRKATLYEQDQKKAGSHDGVKCSDIENLSIKGDPIKEDPTKDFIKKLTPKLEVDLAALMTLTEEEYQELLKDNCALLKELNIPEQSVKDAARFCEEQQASLKKKRELVKFYEENRRLQEAF